MEPPRKFEFHHPTRICLFGVSGSGKTMFAEKLIQQKAYVFVPVPQRVIYVYKYAQPFFNTFPNVEFTQEMPTDLSADTPSLVIIDDVACDKNKLHETAALFARGRHLNTSLVFITQNLFAQNTDFRTISLNTNQFVFFNSIRAYHQIENFARQVFGSNSKYMLDAYKESTKPPFGYLVLDLSNDQTYRLRSKIFADEEEEIYVQ